MNRIELVTVVPAKLQRIPLVEFKRIIFLEFVVHAYNPKTCPVISHCRPTSSAEKIK